MLETFRLSTAVKLPSKSISTLPVIANFGEASSHSKFDPKRVERAFTWNSGDGFGPVSPKTNWGRGKSSPRGDDVSWMTSAFMNPYGVVRTGPILRAGISPSRFGGSIGSTRTGATAAITFGFGASVLAGGAAEEACGALAISVEAELLSDNELLACSVARSESDNTPLAFSSSISCCWLAPLVPWSVPASAAVRTPLVTSNCNNGSLIPAAGLGAGDAAAGEDGSGLALGVADGFPPAKRKRPAENTSNRQRTKQNLFLTSSS